MNPAFKHVFEKAEDSFEDAQLLFSHERFSGTINRCYYAVFYIITAMLMDRGIHVKTHSGIIKKFSEEFIKTGEVPKKLISIYKKIHDERHVADYDMKYQTNAEETAKIIADAREFLDTIKEILDRK